MKDKWKKPYKQTLAKKVKKIEHTLQVRKPESKSKITAAFNQGLAITGVAVALCDIAEGVTSLSRVGLDIQCTSINFHYVLSHDGGTNVSRARIMIVRDKQQISDTPPIVDDVLRNIAISSVSQYSEIHKGRFEVLYDKTHSMDYYNRTGHGKVKLNLSKKGVTRYNGSLATDTQKNQYYLMWVSDQTTFVPAMTYSCMLRYIDC